MRLALAASALVLAATAASAGPAGPAVPRPDAELSLGTTFGANGSIAEGGAAARLALTWPASPRFGFGVELHADDLGTHTGHLYDPNTGEDLGSIATAHRWAFGAAWVGEARLAQAKRWESHAQVSWGYGRLQDDRLGATLDAVSGITMSVGVSAARRVTATHALGLALRYRRLSLDRGLSNQRANQYATAAAEWRWAPPRRD